MELVEQVISLISGEAGALAVLVLLSYLLISGHLFTKKYVEQLEKEHDELAKANAATQSSLKSISDTSKESLENSKTILSLIRKARHESGITGGE